MYATFWSLVPPIIAILLALVTKEVYSSLFIGIMVGGIFYAVPTFGEAGFFGGVESTVLHIFQDGIVASLSDSWI